MVLKTFKPQDLRTSPPYNLTTSNLITKTSYTMSKQHQNKKAARQAKEEKKAMKVLFGVIAVLVALGILGIATASLL